MTTHDRIDTPGQDPQARASGPTVESGGGDNSQDLRNQIGAQLQPLEADKSREPDRRFKQNEALPIHSLPTEIFLQVIHYHMRPYFKDFGSDYYRHLIRLTGVCSRWCYIIRDSPSLWNRIHWSDTSEVVGTALQRSSSHPLDVVLDTSANMLRGQNYMSSLMTTLNPHRHRWRSMDISVPGPWMGEVIAGLREPTGSLEKLSLTDEYNTSSTGENDLFGGTAPRLTELTLNGVSIRWDSEVLYDLTVLDLSWIRFPSTRTILNILLHSPQLRTAVIYRCTTDSMHEPSSSSIQLPHLASLQLDLGALGAIEEVLEHIAAPGRCSLATSLQVNEKIEEFLQRRLLKWMLKWKFLALDPHEGLLLEINGGDLRVELSTANRSEPLALAIESPGASWIAQFRVALPQLVDTLASWTKDVTTLRLRLGYPPSGCHDFTFKQSVIEQVSRLPPVTSLEVSGVGIESFLHDLILGDVSSLFRNVCTLSFLNIGAYGLGDELSWMCETVQLVKDAAKNRSDESNYRGQGLKLELHVLDGVTSKHAELVQAAVDVMEGLVGPGNLVVVEDG
ncbi:hypothetical protein FRC04_001089 [Tulasnella sp. 424]|nr:hypothetical protein FRC04_001089 [Tulasnella sp. 424]KAG8969630.1 hypothetical protein FRC05_000995 [Tulasnella sp. 425]